jgi:predicted nucleotidyltransferase
MIYSINELREKIAPIAAKYELSAVWLFGSYARGDEMGDSDVDILIDRTDSRVSSLFELGAVYNDLCESVGAEIDLITTRALFQDGDNDRAPQFAENVLKERVLVYGKR